MRKALIFLKIIQIVYNKERDNNGLKRLGKGHFKAHRLNPYNPLSYFTIIIVLIVGIILFGFCGIFKEIDLKNPFKWD